MAASPASSTSLTACRLTATATSTWPTAPTGASRCSIRTAISLRIILLNVPYDKTMQPVLGNVNPDLPDATRPWSLCITPGDPQFLWAGDEHPGRIYKLTLDGKIVGVLGEAGRQLGQFNWLHGIDCSQEGVLYIADLNNWRVQKLILNP